MKKIASQKEVAGTFFTCLLHFVNVEVTHWHFFLHSYFISFDIIASNNNNNNEKKYFYTRESLSLLITFIKLILEHKFFSPSPSIQSFVIILLLWYWRKENIIVEWIFHRMRVLHNKKILQLSSWYKYIALKDPKKIMEKRKIEAASR